MVSKAALVIPIAVGAAGVSLYAYLRYHRRNKKKDDEIPKDWTEHKLVLNKAYAHLVLGQLDYIRQKSNILIRVLKIPNDGQTFSIAMKGTPESVQEAEFMVNRLIESSPEIATRIVEIPKEKIKLIVGDFGNNLLNISKETGSRLLLKCDADYNEVSPFYIEIQGPRKNNALAYELIRQALGKESIDTPSPSTNKWNDFPKESALDIINASQNSKYVEVTISSITDVNHFYVQLFRLSSALVKMEERLADYYNQQGGILWEIKMPKVGAMVAVPYKKQGKWHRAIITDLKDKNSIPRIVRARFVDYGDEEDVNVNEIRILPLEFSEYPYFAVECSLAGVLPKKAEENETVLQPLISSEMSEDKNIQGSHQKYIHTVNRKGIVSWCEEAMDFFESLVSDKPNKILMAKKCGEFDAICKQLRFKRERKSRGKIPLIDLVDTNSAEDVDIAIELISKGFAFSYAEFEKMAEKAGTITQYTKISPEDDDLYEEEFEMP